MANEQLAVVNVHSTGSVTTRDVIDTLARRSHVWLAALAAWGLLVALYLVLSPRRYEAETVLLVKNGRADLILSPDERGRYQGDQKESAIATELELLSQQDLLRTVVQRTGTAKERAALDESVQTLRKNLEITPVFKADLIRIKYIAENRGQALKVLSTLLNCYMDRHLEIHHSGGAYPFFDQQVEVSLRELRGAEDKLGAFEKQTGIVLLNNQKEAAVQGIADLEVSSRNSSSAFDEARRQAELLAQRRGSLPARITTQMRRIPNQYSIERLNTMLTELQNKRTELLAKFPGDNRLVKETDQQITDTRMALNQAQSGSSTEEATDINPLHQSVEKELAAAEVNAETSRIRHQVLTRQIQQQQNAIARLDGLTAEHENLVREVKRLEENYRLYSGKREEARISDAMDKQKIANVVIAEPPVASTLPKPKLSGGLAGVFMLGCAVVLTLTFAIGGRRRTFDTPWELEAFTAMPVLAALPHENTLSPRSWPRPGPSARDLATSGGD